MNKKIIVVILAVIMVVGNAMSVFAYTTDAMKSINNNTLERTSFKKDWEEPAIDIIVKYQGEELLPVSIVCGFDSRLFLSDKDYVKKVGGSSSEYAACGYVANSGSWDYTKWTISSTNSGTAKVTHDSDNVIYGVKIDYDPK